MVGTITSTPPASTGALDNIVILQPVSTDPPPPEPPPKNFFQRLMGADNYMKSFMVTQIGISGIASYKLAPSISENMLNFFSKEGPGIGVSAKNMGVTTLKGVVGGSIAAAGIGAISTMAIGLATGNTKDAKQAALLYGIGGAAGGFTATLAGGLSHTLFRSLGVAGIPLSIASTVIGTAVGTVAGIYTPLAIAWSQVH